MKRLPVDRVRDVAIFEVIGIDLAGPLHLKDGSKAWICLFTCAIYKAVNLELLSSLSTICFLESFRGFIARRGRPFVVFVDNGTNFVGAESSLKKLNWEKIAEYSTAKRIVRNFNPPSAAWWGGWWERLVGLMKQFLRHILGRACLDYENMITVLCDCESILNSRPLTYISNDCNDLLPLTPNMFLQEIRETGTPDFDNVAAIDIREKSNYNQKLCDDLRRRFRSEYLGQLQESAKLAETRELKISDLVFFGSDDQKRIDWPLSRVIAVFKGKDGKVRFYRVKPANGELTRPIQPLYPLELDCPGSSDIDNASKDIMFDKISKIRDQCRINSLPERKCVKKMSLSVENESLPYTTRSGRTVKKNVVKDLQ